MAAQDTWKRRAAQAREELEQTGRVVLRAPVLVQGAECIIRFFLAAVVAGAAVLGDYAPFGVSMVAAAGAGLGGFFALLGACYGYFSFLGFPDGLRAVAASILTFSVAFAFCDLPLYRRPWFMPAAAAVLSGATGFVYLSEVGWRAADVVFFATETLFAGAGAYCFRTALDHWAADAAGGEPEDARRTVSLLFLTTALLMALSQVYLPGHLSLGRVLAAAAVMACAAQGGLGVGAGAGLAAGLAMDLAHWAGPYYVLAYGAAGLVTGAFQGQNRLFQAAAYVAANTAAVLWTWDQGVRIGLLYEVFVGSVVFFILPQPLLRRLTPLFGGQAAGDGGDYARRHTQEKLKETAAAFRTLSDSLRDCFRTPSNDEDAAVIFDRAADRVCRRCALRDACWQRDYITTFNAMNSATPALLDRGRAEAGDFPGHFTGRCLHFPQLLDAVNREVAALLIRRQYRSRLGESRAAVGRQYALLGTLLRRAAEELSEELTPDPVVLRRLRGHLAARGLEGPCTAYRTGAGRLRFTVPRHPLWEEEEERQALAALFRTPLHPPVAEGETLTFTQAEPLAAVAGVAARPKEGETVSGDAGAWFRRPDGALYLLLCDGMGSGEAARGESGRAVKLLEQFLRAEVDAAQALTVLSAALALRGEGDGGFTTIDLLEVDLFTGAAAVYKYGGAPTYLRSGDGVRRVTGAALPAGLAAGEGGGPDRTGITLNAGDWVVLVSDGVVNPDGDGWLRETLRTFSGDSPRRLAETILARSDEHTGPGDDRTVLTLRLAPRPGPSPPGGPPSN